MSLEYKVPTIYDLTESTFDIFINLSANDFGYEVTTNDLIVNWVNPTFMKAHAEDIKEDKPNWNQEMNGPFSDEYWQAA